MMNTTLGHDYVVAKVDKLVSDILDPIISISIQEISNQLSAYYQLMLFHFNDELVYTNSIKWFMGSCYLVCGNNYPNEVIWTEGMTQNFLTALGFYHTEFATDRTDFAFQEQRNSQSLFDCMNYFLNEYSRLLIVRVDLKIKVEFAHTVNVEAFNNFMNDLREDIGRKKGCFRYLRGHAWAIEQGVDSGLHCHLLLLYNGDKRWKDWYLADAIGKHWVEITEGIGWYFNCNTTEHKRSYDLQGTLGIGMIHRDNLVEVNNAINAALYLTRPKKYEQRLKAWLPNMRTFGRSTISTS
ncbi:inovirus-type Gp2 protein [Psychrobacter sp. Ps7]|uniref:YagK/YfjJ domain-containing protein n=1 Tax=Psychrobacter sp. Ps7 TaxID=2790961 RepID=UPI001EDE153A|nr:inovirus-type Gp2 protein [Psychrobacter sp. Ps7]MCG3873894.1 inovirus-type Gp2 protein [Psychrobacter sp. Ps7]